MIAHRERPATNQARSTQTGIAGSMVTTGLLAVIWAAGSLWMSSCRSGVVRTDEQCVVGATPRAVGRTRQGGREVVARGGGWHPAAQRAEQVNPQSALRTNSAPS